jgi:hypothetical protein
MKNQTLKIFFGLIIFLFSVALAYFTANYVSTSGYFDYWATLAIFGAVYVLIGVAVSMIFSISLGFLFAADVVILHLLFQYYGQWADTLKLILIGGILVILYACAAVFLADKKSARADPTPHQNPTPDSFPVSPAQ